MGLLKAIKAALVVGSVVGLLLWAATNSSSKAVPAELTLEQQGKSSPTPPATAKAATSDDYVGSQACQICHEDQFKNFSHTAHGRLENLSSWKGRIVGCEACHGPGKAHIELESGDTQPNATASADLKIISFKNRPSKEASETCLTCHSGKEEHNNFRRGEHWRNDVGCTDCHSPHDPPTGKNLAESNTFVSAANAEKPGFQTIKLLRTSEPQLCLKCHTEQKQQFNQPFHHKVLEGAMRCSDCHNPHGGFETKQTRLATGADAACLKCHSNKQGPFAFEHAPVKTEGCASCHTPHGSSNPRLLRTSTVTQLCLECHSQAHNIGANEIGAPETPTFHNLSVSTYQNCTSCHVRIHGSHTSPVFFR